MASAKDVAKAESVGLYLGYAARLRSSNTRIMDLILQLADVYDQNPNITNQGLADYYGLTETNINVWQRIQFNKSSEYMREKIWHIRDIEPDLPHPMFYPALVPLVVAFSVVGIVVMSARFYSRLSIAGRIPFYDWLMLVGFILTETMMGVIVADSYTARNGSASYDQTWVDLVNDCIFLNIRDVLYPVAALVIKSSLLLFYYRLSPTNSSILKYVVIITFIISLGSCVPAVVVNLVYYGDVDWWNHLLDEVSNEPEWLNYSAEFMATGALNILTDVIIWAIPIVLIWKPMQRRGRPERIATLMLFTLGAVVCVTGALRIATFWELTNAGGNGPLASIPISVWSIIELQLAIICASVPALRALVVKYFPKILGLRSSIVVGSSFRRRSHHLNEIDAEDWDQQDTKNRGSEVPTGVTMVKAPSSSRFSRSTGEE